MCVDRHGPFSCALSSAPWWVGRSALRNRAILGSPALENVIRIDAPPAAVTAGVVVVVPAATAVVCLRCCFEATAASLRCFEVTAKVGKPYSSRLSRRVSRELRLPCFLLAGERVCCTCEYVGYTSMFALWVAGVCIQSKPNSNKSGCGCLYTNTRSTKRAPRSNCRV